MRYCQPDSRRCDQQLSSTFLGFLGRLDLTYAAWTASDERGDCSHTVRSEVSIEGALHRVATCGTWDVSRLYADEDDLGHQFQPRDSSRCARVMVS